MEKSLAIYRLSDTNREIGRGILGEMAAPLITVMDGGHKMTDDQINRRDHAWQEPTVSVQAFAENDTRITVERATLGDGAWLNFKGDASMTGVSICMNKRAVVERLRDALSAYLESAE